MKCSTVKAFDEMFSNTVAISSSYMFSEIVYGAKFTQMFDDEDDTITVLDLSKLNTYKKIDI